MDIEKLVKTVIQTACMVKYKLGKYFNESVYQSGMLKALEKQGIHAEKEAPIKIYLDGEVIAELRMDIIVENQLILELKATDHLTIEHEKQLVSYLQASDYEHGLLINFCAENIEIKRKYRTYKKSTN